MSKKYCAGCGVLIQTEHPLEKGYVLTQHVDTGRCQRCFKINQYSEFQKVDIDNEKLYQMIQAYNPEINQLVLVVDMLDMIETCLFELADILAKYELIVVVNKIDAILPEMRRFDLWEEYLRACFKEHKLTIKEIFFTSARELLGIKRLLRYLENLTVANLRIIGCANVGKSSLIQALFTDSEEIATVLPTIFMAPGTTLEELAIPWKTYTIFDTPGIMKPEQLTYYLTNKMLKDISIRNSIHPRNYQIYEPQTFYIGGYAQINIIPDGRNTVSFFCANNIKVHRKKYQETDEFYQKHIGTLLVPPHKKEYQKIPQLAEKQTHPLEITRNKTDIVISGLGWIALHHQNARVEVITVAGVKVYTQHSII